MLYVPVVTSTISTIHTRRLGAPRKRPAVGTKSGAWMRKRVDRTHVSVDPSHAIVSSVARNTQSVFVPHGARFAWDAFMIVCFHISSIADTLIHRIRALQGYRIRITVHTASVLGVLITRTRGYPAADITSKPIWTHPAYTGGHHEFARPALAFCTRCRTGLACGVKRAW